MKQSEATVPPPAALDTTSNAIADGLPLYPSHPRQNTLANSCVYVNSGASGKAESGLQGRPPALLNPDPSTEHLDRPLHETEFKALWPYGERYARRLIRHFSARVGLRLDRQIENDLLQEVAAALLLAVRRGAVRASLHALNGWLRIVVRRLVARSKRRAALEQRDDNVDVSDLAEFGERHDDEARAADSIAADRVLAGLKPRERVALRLRAEGQSHAQIAAALRTTTINARVVLHRARRNARKALGVAEPQRRQPAPTRNMALLVLASACVFLPACIDLPKPEPKAVTALGVALDLSTSTANAPDDRCGEFVARVRETLNRPGTRRLDVIALGTGDASTGLEPIVLVPWMRFEPSGHLYERPGHAEAERDAWIDSVGARCRASARATDTSPIYASVARVAESLRARCTEIEAQRERCERRLLAVHSDLRENADPAITAALRAATRRRGGIARLNKALPHLDLEAVELTVCGVAETRSPPEEYVAPGALSNTWSQVFGANAPAFNAACPRAAAPSSPTSAAASPGVAP